jgi:hypothetical protein
LLSNNSSVISSFTWTIFLSKKEVTSQPMKASKDHKIK